MSARATACRTRRCDLSGLMLAAAAAQTLAAAVDDPLRELSRARAQLAGGRAYVLRPRKTVRPGGDLGPCVVMRSVKRLRSDPELLGRPIRLLRSQPRRRASSRSAVICPNGRTIFRLKTTSRAPETYLS